MLFWLFIFTLNCLVKLLIYIHHSVTGAAINLKSLIHWIFIPKTWKSNIMRIPGWFNNIWFLSYFYVLEWILSRCIEIVSACKKLFVYPPASTFEFRASFSLCNCCHLLFFSKYRCSIPVNYGLIHRLIFHLINST